MKKLEIVSEICGVSLKIGEIVKDENGWTVKFLDEFYEKETDYANVSALEIYLIFENLNFQIQSGTEDYRHFLKEVYDYTESIQIDILKEDRSILKL